METKVIEPMPKQNETHVVSNVLKQLKIKHAYLQ